MSGTKQEETHGASLQTGESSNVDNRLCNLKEVLPNVHILDHKVQGSYDKEWLFSAFLPLTCTTKLVLASSTYHQAYLHPSVVFILQQLQPFRNFWWKQDNWASVGGIKVRDPFTTKLQIETWSRNMYIHQIPGPEYFQQEDSFLLHCPRSFYGLGEIQHILLWGSMVFRSNWLQWCIGFLATWSIWTTQWKEGLHNLKAHAHGMASSQHCIVILDSKFSHTAIKQGRFSSTQAPMMTTICFWTMQQDTRLLSKDTCYCVQQPFSAKSVLAETLMDNRSNN